jgi:Tfp pilus assembly major pilin PilA
MYKFLSFLLICCFGFTNAQELNCTVTVDFQKIGTTNQKVFKTLESSLNELVNKTTWTTTPYKPAEKISCSMTIIVEGYENDEFTASLQIQSSRTAFNSTYQSPMFNFNDKNFSFKYQEFESLLYNPNNYDSNLVGVIAFYSNIIIALDQDSFAANGGDTALEAAVNINNLAQSSGYKGWSSSEKGQNRFLLINDLVSPTFSPFREVLLDYHLNGIDLMSKDTKQAKTKIITAINNLKTIHLIRPNSFLMRVFFDAKSDEIISIFTGGPRIPVDDLLAVLNQVSPMNSGKWGGIN